MKIQAPRNIILSSLGLISLLVYVLACTSFSPDDSKVLFPAFDVKSGATSAMVYDRKSGKTEQVFIALNPAELETTNAKASLLRAQWLPDGKAILVAWQPESGQDTLELTIVPFGVREPVRTMRLADSSLENALLTPVPIVGSQIFLASKKTVDRIDIVTGAVRSRDFTNELSLYPDPDGKKLFCWSEVSRDDGKFHQFGAINPETLAFAPLIDLTEGKDFELATFAFGPGGNPIVLLGKPSNSGMAELRVFRDGKLASTRQVDLGTGALGIAPLSALSPRGDCLYASYSRRNADKTRCEYGLLEVPVTQGPARLTTLLEAPGGGDDVDPIMFQGGLSHDGRAWAVASAYLWAQNEKIANEDCVLFLVDLTDAKRKVTKVAIPAPANRKELFK